ncbi:Uncharacterized protein TCM_027239 [Theobroma cacao]|uniref:Uncharacterized protein n=1 Tax=Theobroma cacao TaxID=3641 RepID=A0A061G8W8_THECC|nr:Uncharacterized protein TCM_027239 [Theobroma cacao]
MTSRLVNLGRLLGPSDPFLEAPLNLVHENQPLNKLPSFLLTPSLLKRCIWGLLPVAFFFNPITLFSEATYPVLQFFDPSSGTLWCFKRINSLSTGSSTYVNSLAGYFRPPVERAASNNMGFPITATNNLPAGAPNSGHGDSQMLL